MEVEKVLDNGWFDTKIPDDDEHVIDELNDELDDKGSARFMEVDAFSNEHADECDLDAEQYLIIAHTLWIICSELVSFSFFSFLTS